MTWKVTKLYESGIESEALFPSRDDALVHALKYPENVESFTIAREPIASEHSAAAAKKWLMVSNLRHSAAAAKKWLEDHGGDLAGYIERYGSKDDPNHYGNGGEAIFAADLAELKRLEEKENAE